MHSVTSFFVIALKGKLYIIDLLVYYLDKEIDSSRDIKRVDKEEKKKESAPCGKAKVTDKVEKNNKDLKGDAADGKGDVNDKKPLKKDASETGEEVRNVVKKEQVATAGAQTISAVKSGKKKIIKKIVKQKVVGKPSGESTGNQQQDEKVNEEKDANLKTPGQQDESLSNSPGVKTFVRKKVANKVGKSNEKEDNETQLEVKVEKETDCSEDKPKKNSVPSGGAVMQDTSTKTIIRKKIIKRVPKRKVAGGEATNGVSNVKKDGGSIETNVVQVGDATENTKNQTADAENMVSEVKKTEKKIIPKLKSPKPNVIGRQDSMVNSSNSGIKNEKVEKKDVKGTGERSGSGNREEIEAEKQKIPENDNHDDKQGKLKDIEKSKDEKEKKGDGKDESRSKSNKELKEKRKPEEPPRHPGLILQTRWSKDSKVGYHFNLSLCISYGLHFSFSCYLVCIPYLIHGHML